MRLDKLIPTHNYLRNPNAVLDIMDKVRREEFDNNEVCMIFLIGDYTYIGNGHHRLKSFYSLGYIDTDELPFPVQFKNFSFSDLMSVNFTAEYVTPYNCKLECRKPDFYSFKQRVMNIYRNWDEIEALTYIVNNYNVYKEPRQIGLLEELS